MADTGKEFFFSKLLFYLTNKNTLNKTFGNISRIINIFISMAGYVPNHATIGRTFALGLSLIFAVYLSIYEPFNTRISFPYFVIGEVLYVGFIMTTLSKNGLRHWFIRKWGEEKGYLTYEGILGFLFFHNAICIGYIASSTPGDLFSFIDRNTLFLIVLILFAGGFLIKIFAAKAVSIDIYYCKDMFLGRKISDFVVSGPYKYFKNPMYGVGQLQAYATAIWYGSEYGLAAAFLNQALVYSFYFLVEKKFVRRTYLQTAVL